MQQSMQAELELDLLLFYLQLAHGVASRKSGSWFGPGKFIYVGVSVLVWLIFPRDTREGICITAHLHDLLFERQIYPITLEFAKKGVVEAVPIRRHM